MSLYN